MPEVYRVKARNASGWDKATGYACLTVVPLETELMLDQYVPTQQEARKRPLEIAVHIRSTPACFVGARLRSRAPLGGFLTPE